MLKMMAMISPKMEMIIHKAKNTIKVFYDTQKQYLPPKYPGLVLNLSV